ncbi:hypothetical protein O0L34_g2566 [Tuta absoluta]|nr:hypothetical protein O0L34_g2566 [Tuta absoluta]
MVRSGHLLLVVMLTVSATNSEIKQERRARRKNEFGDKSLWKKEYEEELTDAMLSTRKRDNLTRVAQSTAVDNEAVVERLMDSITSSEKYLKKVDNIDFRLNRLDIEIHEKTNNIMKHLAEISKGLRLGVGTQPDKTDTILDGLKNEIYEIKSLLESNQRVNNVDGADSYHAETHLDTRLSGLEAQMKNMMASVDSIATIIGEVKTRQNPRQQLRTDTTPPFDSMSLISEFRKSLHEQKRKCDCRNGRVDRTERYPTDCHEIQMQGFNVSGIYKIKPEEMEPFYVLCDLITAGGGWTVLQNRFDGSQDFYKSWNDYKNGFGNLAGEFWLGLEKVNFLTNQKLYELRVEIEAQTGHEAYAAYSVFTVGPEHEGFRISTLGTYHGTAGDSLSYHAGQKFSTFDADNDEWKDGACAVEHGGAWWYKECDKSNLNGKYSNTPDEHRGQSMYWISFKGPNFPLMKTKMMIRPLPASRPNELAESTRKILESSIMRPAADKLRIHVGDRKSQYDPSLQPQSFRYDNRPEGFFPSYK